MAEYIEREAVLKLKRKMNGADFGGEFWDEAVLCEDIRNIPAADVVSREVFEQVRWERDTALQTLQEHGIGLGQKADVVEVVRCKDCVCHNVPPCPMRLSLNWTNDNDFCSYGEKKEGVE